MPSRRPLPWAGSPLGFDQSYCQEFLRCSFGSMFKYLKTGIWKADELRSLAELKHEVGIWIVSDMNTFSYFLFPFHSTMNLGNLS